MKYTALKTLSILTLTFTLASTANAGMTTYNAGNEITSVEFEFIDNLYGNIAASGKFSGVDNNSDGFLTTNEVTMLRGFSFEVKDFNFSHFLDIGDYDIANNKWLSNAMNFRGEDVLWLKFDNGGVSELTSISWTVKTSSQSTSVPEPPMLLLLGTVFAGLAGMRRRHS